MTLEPLTYFPPPPFHILFFQNSSYSFHALLVEFGNLLLYIMSHRTSVSNGRSPPVGHSSFNTLATLFCFKGATVRVSPSKPVTPLRLLPLHPGFKNGTLGFTFSVVFPSWSCRIAFNRGPSFLCLSYNLGLRSPPDAFCECAH